MRRSGSRRRKEKRKYRRRIITRKESERKLVFVSSPFNTQINIEIWQTFVKDELNLEGIQRCRESNENRIELMTEEINF